jgi:hypothetical protein
MSDQGFVQHRLQHAQGTFLVGLRILVIIVTYVAGLVVPESECLQKGPIYGRPISVHYRKSIIWDIGGLARFPKDCQIYFRARSPLRD